MFLLANYSAFAMDPLPPAKRIKLEDPFDKINEAYSRSNTEEIEELLNSVSSDTEQLDRLITYIKSKWNNEVVEDFEHKTILDWAASKGHLAVVESVMRVDSGLLWQTTRNGSTSLHLATGHGHLPVVQVLMRHEKVRENLLKSQDSKGFTALHIAALKGNLLIVQELMGHFTDSASAKEFVGLTNNEGLTARDLAVAYRQKNVEMELSQNHVAESRAWRTSDLSIGIYDFLYDVLNKKNSNINADDLSYCPFLKPNSTKTLIKIFNKNNQKIIFSDPIDNYDFQLLFGEGKAFSEVKHLDLSGSSLNETLLEGLPSTLRSLKLAVRINQATQVIASSPSLRGLKYLDISESQLDARGAANIAESAHLFGLEHLNVSNTLMGHRGLFAITHGNLTGLLQLTANEASVNGRMFRAVWNGNLGNLKHLDLRNNVIALADRRPLGKGNLSRLEYLDLRENLLTPDGAIAISRGNLTSLKDLRLGCNWIGDKGLFSIARARFPGLTHLEVGNYADMSEEEEEDLITAEGVLRAFAENALLSLTHLDLKNIEMNEEEKRLLQIQLPNVQIEFLNN